MLQRYKDLAHRFGHRFILLTDGRQYEDASAALAAAHELRGDGVALYVIGLGEDVDADFLAELTDPQRYFFAPNANDPAAIYRRIATTIPCVAEDYWGRRCW